jgi:outer membrane protein assembly factor BamB
MLLWELEDLSCFAVRTGEELFRYRLAVRLRTGAFTASPAVHAGSLYLGEENGALRLDLERLESGSDPVRWFSEGPGTDCASPVVANGLLFLVSEAGVASARDVETGQIVWEEQLDGSEYFASPVTDGRSVLFCARDGKCAFVAAARRFEIRARHTMPPGLMATPALQAGAVYVRVAGTLSAFGAAAPPGVQ